MYGDSWKKHWIRPGVEVYHRSAVKADGSLTEDAVALIVDRVVRKNIAIAGREQMPFRVLGVMCHWFKDSQYRKGQFMTKELVPADVVRKLMLVDWEERFR